MAASSVLFPSMFNFATLPPLSLYVHLPWCVRKCPYCDFNSHEARGQVPEQEYIEALLRDLEQDLPRVWGRPVQSVFFGGGTPSLFSPEAVDRLLSEIRARLPLNQDAEITLEANPGTVDNARFTGFRDAGINRLSIGIQSFDDEKLRALGRIHGSNEARRAVEAARAAGFDNFNLDLMFGLPTQSVEQAVADVRAAIAFQPTHLSVYQLTVEPNTLFHARPPALPDEDAIWDMQTRLQAELAAAGYRQYEVSAYARPGYECRHNLNYWLFGDYLGIGAGAHAKITERVTDDAQACASAAKDKGLIVGSRLPGAAITRLWKVKQPREYLRRAGTPVGIGGVQELSRDDVVTEFMLNALRLVNGFPSHLFQERAGMPLAVCEKPLRLAESRGLVDWNARQITPTPQGRRFLDNLVELFA